MFFILYYLFIIIYRFCSNFVEVWAPRSNFALKSVCKKLTKNTKNFRPTDPNIFRHVSGNTGIFFFFLGLTWNSECFKIYDWRRMGVASKVCIFSIHTSNSYFWQILRSFFLLFAVRYPKWIIWMSRPVLLPLVQTNRSSNRKTHKIKDQTFDLLSQHNCSYLSYLIRQIFFVCSIQTSLVGQHKPLFGESFTSTVTRNATTRNAASSKPLYIVIHNAVWKQKRPSEGSIVPWMLGLTSYG